MNNIFIEIFSSLPDKRVKGRQKHLFLEIIGLALFGVLAGAQNYVEIEDFCRAHFDWLKGYFSLPNGIPSHDTFSRVFAAINHKAFQSCFLDWTRSIIKLFPEQVIALDGKSIRASKRVKQGLRALHLVSAFSCANGFSLGQVKVDDKTNEISAIPELLKTLCLEGAIVTLDAMGCQKSIAKQIISLKGNYLLRVKANQGDLQLALEKTFAKAAANHYQAISYFTATDTPNNDHGRLENRHCIVLPMMYLYGMKLPWEGLKSLVCLISKRENLAGQLATEHRYYISSLAPNEPEKIMHAIREHWHIENNLHWCLDVVYREDQSRIRDENSALNFAWLRKTALALLKRADLPKKSLRRKQLALWANPRHLIDIIKL